MGVLALVENLESEFVVREALAELLPRHLVPNILEDLGDLTLVIRVLAPLDVLALTLDNEDRGEWKFLLRHALLRDEVGIQADVSRGEPAHLAVLQQQTNAEIWLVRIIFDQVQIAEMIRFISHVFKHTEGHPPASKATDHHRLALLSFY